MAPAVEAPIVDDAPLVAFAPAASAVDVSTPLPFTRTVWAGVAPRRAPEPAAEASRRPTWTQVIAGLFGAAGLGLVAIAGIFLVRAFLSLPFMQDFLAAFPGSTTPRPPPASPDGSAGSTSSTCS
ncbi:hypothetical protein L2X99_17050 [Microbacterium sp. KUDC0406]|uniref:hypothetical protein n=1 Tax=Microbacterium sp. KUDC0406 TaxID=2909588 RepID=UPI001F407AA3|nr:hypothetical protein [Microbacterium sp. KUDC0406]UJP10038.1 hypothetical protein L2X99_17050 [Microbacterium sp. KUDC0406]